MKEIQLAHGGGGEEMNELLQRLFSLFDNGILKEANDAAIVSFGENGDLNSSENTKLTQNNDLNLKQSANFSQSDSPSSNENLKFAHKGDLNSNNKASSAQNGNLNLSQNLEQNSTCAQKSVLNLNDKAKLTQNNDLNSKQSANSVQKSLNLSDKFAISTDSFTLSPIFLDDEVNIGKLCVCGSVNDVLMVGAEPEFLSLAFIIEEGLSVEKLDKIAQSIKKECDKAGVQVVCGDTKVVPKGKGDEIYINTTAFGRIVRACETKNIRQGLSVLVSGDIGRHGAAVLVQRNALEASVKSDCKCLKDEVMSLLRENVEVVAMRDATRGGLSAVLNEWARQSGLDIVIFEEKIIIKDEVKGICELFGYEAYELANEGTFVLCVEKAHEQRALQILQKFNKNASIIGEVLENRKSRVILQNAYGAKRFLEAPKGELLPRIC